MRASTAVFLSGLAATQAFCPAPATSGVLSLRAQSEGVSRRSVLAGFLGGASLAAVNVIAPADANAVCTRRNNLQFLDPPPPPLSQAGACVNLPISKVLRTLNQGPEY